MHAGKKAREVRAEVAVREAAQKRYDEARRAAEAAGVEGGPDVLDALLATFHDALRWQEVCKQLLGELEEIRYKSRSGEQLRAEVQLFERSLDRTARIGADLVRLDIESRLAKVTELQNRQLTDAIVAALDELAEPLQLDASSPLVRETVARHLRTVTR